MRNKPLLAAFLLLAAQKLFFLLSFPPLLEPDSGSYIAAAVNALAGGGFGSGTRPPGYPAFLAAFYSLFGPGNLPVIIFQHALGLALWAVFAGMLKTLRERLIFSALYFLDLLYCSYQHVILADFLFSFAACLSAWAVWMYLRARSAAWLLACGAFVALGILVKPALKLFPLFILPLFLLERRPAGARLRAAALFLALPLLAMNLWSLRNYRAGGPYALVPQESYHYIGRVVNHLAFPENSASERFFLARLGGKQVPRDGKAAVSYDVAAGMKAAGIKEDAIYAEFAQVFRLSVLRHPLSYLKESSLELFYFFFSAHNLYAKNALGDRLPVSAEQGLRSGNPGGVLLKVALSMHPFYWGLFALLVWYAAANAGSLAASRDLFLLYAYGLITYIALVSSLANEGLARYRAAVQPLMLLIAAMALSDILRRRSGGEAGEKP